MCGQPRVFGRVHDAPCVPRRGRSAVTGVDEHGLAGRGDEERGIATLHVDDVDVQRAPRLGGEKRTGDADSQQKDENPCTHDTSPCRVVSSFSPRRSRRRRLAEPSRS